MGDWKLITFNVVFLAGAYFIKASIRVAICFYAVLGQTLQVNIPVFQTCMMAYIAKMQKPLVLTFFLSK